MKITIYKKAILEFLYIFKSLVIYLMLNPCHTLLRSGKSLHCAGKVNKTQEDRGKLSKMVKFLKHGSS